MKLKIIRQIIIMSKFILYGIFLQAFLCSFLLANEGRSQRKSLEEIYISIDLKNNSLQETFQVIENKTNFVFAFEKALIDEKDVSITTRSKNESLASLLRQISKDAGLSFKRINESIHVAKREYQQAPLTDIIYPIDQTQLKVTGRVTSAEDEEPLPGVSILIKGQTVGTTTDIDGNYSLSVTSDAVLQYSYIGFITKEITVNNQSKIDVQLMPDLEELEEVVVVGYGVQKKSDVTGSMVSVSSKELNVRPVTNAFEALQGNAAGVDITNSDRPGEVGSIRIRGVRSLNASSDPLYVVDGVPLMSSSAIETLNPKDIESIDVLKDASATAIYGSRGANGVIIVTTKKGKPGRFSLNYSGAFTAESIVDRNPSMNASDYITWRRWAYHNADPDNYAPGNAPTLENDEKIFNKSSLDFGTSWNNILNGWESGSWNPSKVSSTDFTDFVSKTGLTQQHTVSASGGTEKMNVYASFGYLDQEGTQIGQAYQRYTSNLSLDISPKDWFSLGGSINGSWSDQDYGMSTTGASSGSSPNSIYGAAKSIYAYAVPYDSLGQRIIYPGSDENVYTIIGEEDYSLHQRQMFRVIGSFYGTLDIGKITNPLKGLKYRVNFGPDFRNWREGVYIDQESVVRLGGTSFARLSNQRDFSWTLDNMLTYNKTLGVHDFGFTLLQTASSWNIESNSMSGINIPKASYLWNAFGSLDITDASYSASMGSGLSERQLTSYMFRLNYSLSDKYLITTSGRWDGASQLSDGHKWAFFPSVALGWRISEEGFLSSSNKIDQLKLRLGFGTTGNSAVSPYQTLGSVTSFYVPFGGESNELAYAINEQNYNKNSIPMANKSLSWEKTTQYNLGVDFSFFNGRVSGTLDLYKSYTKDLIMSMSIPTISGYKSTYANVGETKNKGVDITVNTVNVLTKDFEWRTNINAAWQKNEIVELAYGKNDMVDNGWFIGEELYVYYGYEADGIWQANEAEEMAKFNENGYNFEAGKVKPIDQNGDYEIDDEDRVIIGNRSPHWTAGFNNTFSYKNFELTAIIYGRLGYTNSTGGHYQGGRYNQTEIDYWTPDNTDAEYQKPIYSESGGDPYYSLLGYFSGSYIKLRTVSLGYFVPQQVTRKLKLQSLKLYAQAKNIAMLYSPIDFKDMDTGSTLFNRGFVFGVDVSF